MHLCYLQRSFSLRQGCLHLSSGVTPTLDSSPRSKWLAHSRGKWPYKFLFPASQCGSCPSQVLQTLKTPRKVLIGSSLRGIRGKASSGSAMLPRGPQFHTYLPITVTAPRKPSHRFANRAVFTLLKKKKKCGCLKPGLPLTCYTSVQGKTPMAGLGLSDEAAHHPGPRGDPAGHAGVPADLKDAHR